MVFIPHVPHGTKGEKDDCCGRKRLLALTAGLGAAVAVGLAAFASKRGGDKPPSAAGDPADEMTWMLVLVGVAVLTLGVCLVVILKQKVDR